MVTKMRKLNILMNGDRIGMLEKSTQGILSFTYDENWLNTPGARPISLSLPLIDKTFTGDSVYHFFDNLLPDNSQIRARIQAKFQIDTNQPFDLLATIGKDCVGAIQIIEGAVPLFKQQMKFSPLSEADIARILQSYQTNPLGMTETTSDFRISIAGAQEKSAFLFYQDKWCKPLGDTATSHIFKLPIGIISHQQLDLRDSCENEWLCAKITEAFGLPVAHCEIHHFKEVKVLSVERFDRKYTHDKSWLMRLPQEDMCQALGISPNLKYQADGGPGIKEIMQLLLSSASPSEDRDKFFQAQILFWLLAAIDGHAKNFSLFIEPEGKFRLTPLYDILSAYPLMAKNQLAKQKIKMAMALKGKQNHYHWDKVHRQHFIETAKLVQYSTEKAAFLLNEMLAKVDYVIATVSTKLPKKFPEHIAKPIFDGMRAFRDRIS